MPRVEFTVWDVDEHPLLTSLDVSMVRAGTGSTNAVGLTRGADPGEGVGVGVWSCAPHVIDQFPLWPLEHAAMAFVAPYATALGLPTREAVAQIKFTLKSGEATTLDVDEETIEAVAYHIHDDWRVVASNDRSIPVAIASNGRTRPTALRAI